MNKNSCVFALKTGFLKYLQCTAKSEALEHPHLAHIVPVKLRETF